MQIYMSAEAALNAHIKLYTKVFSSFKMESKKSFKDFKSNLSRVQSFCSHYVQASDPLVNSPSDSFTTMMKRVCSSPNHTC